MSRRYRKGASVKKTTVTGTSLETALSNCTLSSAESLALTRTLAREFEAKLRARQSADES